jgi:hypothetical protein
MGIIEDMASWASTGTGFPIIDTAFNYWSAKKANELTRDMTYRSEAEAARQRTWAQQEAYKTRLFNQNEARTNRTWLGNQAEMLMSFQDKQRMEKQKFDQQMSSSAVSRRMADMKRAGINPILAGKYDASSPASQAMSGAMPGGSSASSSNPSGSAGTGGSTGQKMERSMIASQVADVRLKNANAKLVKEQAEKVKAETGFVGHKSDMAAPVAEFMAGLLQLMKIMGVDRNSASNFRDWAAGDLPKITLPMNKEERKEMFNKAKKRHSKLPGVKDSQRKIFEGI